MDTDYAAVVMDQVLPLTLSDLLRGEKPLFPPVVLRLMVDCFAILLEFEAHGFIHGDIKPGNIGVGADHCVAIDLGSVHPIDRNGVLSSFTPGYALQPAGAQVRCVPFHDLVCLACTLHHCVKGALETAEVTLADLGELLEAD